MKFCPECGAKLENETVKFCPECGKSISTSEKTEVKKATNPLMEEYEYEVLPDGTYAIIRPKDKYKTKYVIPEGDTVIRESAFHYMQMIEEVLLPDGIKVIEKEAFSNLPRLKKINFPQSLYKIEYRAFANTKLQVVEVANNLKEWENAFDSCIVEKVIFDKSVKIIPNGAFSEAQIGDIVFQEGLEVVGNKAFWRATLPEEIKLPRSLNIIGEGAFDSKGVKKIIYSGEVSPEPTRSFWFNGSVISTDKLEKEEKNKEGKKVREKSRGVVDFAGKEDEKDFLNEACIVEKIGDVTFYISNSELVRWESTKKITHLDLSLLNITEVHEMCLKPEIKSVKLPVKEKVFYVKDRPDLGVGIYKVNRVIIPKEVQLFKADRFAMRDIREVEFEDPCGWGVSKKIINDPKKFRDFIEDNERVELQKSFIKKILYKLGL